MQHPPPNPAMPRNASSQGSKASTDSSTHSLVTTTTNGCKSSSQRQEEPCTCRGVQSAKAGLEPSPCLGGEAGQERHTRSAAEAHQDHSCPSPPVLTLPEWAGSPAGAPGRCHCPGSSSLPGQGIWKWFVEAPGKEWRHLQSPSLSCCSPEPSPSSTASRLIYS